VVRELTSILGSEKCNIVVANALRLNGAMIAAAHRASDGTYSGHGALTLKVGELFVQHIYDYDHGYTLGAAISSIAFMPTVGGLNGEDKTSATDNFKENLEKEIQAISCTNKDFMIWYNDINLLNEVNADTAKRIS